jgi:hypothetical protein
VYVGDDRGQKSTATVRIRISVSNSKPFGREPRVRHGHRMPHPREYEESKCECDKPVMSVIDVLSARTRFRVSDQTSLVYHRARRYLQS